MSTAINDLHSRALLGDSDAEKQLFSFLTGRFLTFAHQKVWNNEDAEEIIQNALATVAAEYKTIEIESSFAAWAHKVLEYKFLAYLQTKKRQKGRNVPIDNTEYESGGWTPEPGLKMHLLDCLNKVGRTSRRYARILNLHHLGFTREEICDRLDLTRNQSYAVMSRARAMLRDCLEKGEPVK